jgi:hypothetical protein
MYQEEREREINLSSSQGQNCGYMEDVASEAFLNGGT